MFRKISIHIILWVTDFMCIVDCVIIHIYICVHCEFPRDYRAYNIEAGGYASERYTPNQANIAAA